MSSTVIATIESLAAFVTEIRRLPISQPPESFDTDGLKTVEPVTLRESQLCTDPGSKMWRPGFKVG